MNVEAYNLDSLRKLVRNLYNFFRLKFGPLLILTGFTIDFFTSLFRTYPVIPSVITLWKISSLRYPDQWDILLNHTEKLSKEDIEKYMAKWQGELAKEQI